MADTITVREGVSGNPIAKSTAVHIDVVGSASTTPDHTPARTNLATLPPVGEHVGDTGPVQAALTYHVWIDAPAGVDDAVSPSFSLTPPDYKWSWDGYIFPAAGTYSIKLVEEAGDTAVITQAATVE